ncbi:hypothetical protein LSH36_189g06102 [Paralvinella palmiformis]|uniref:EF-hand domain-containing protein n=1 Tax=Paralvinella palmiformis TaxID=53620 RepID=A0AAD9N6R1_9ANNE|nr:hypothetical protein LSH36_189g06102 [Paralvinella palmiformis]
MAAAPGTTKSRARILKFFNEADLNKNGYLSLEEFGKALKKHGYKMSHLAIKKQFVRFDLNHDNRISPDEFLACMGEMPEHVHDMAAIRKMFLAYDKNGDGVIDRAEMEQVFRDMGWNQRNLKDIDHIMAKLDKNRNGAIEYEEFVRFFGAPQ